MGIAAGVIIILISIAHSIYGEKKQIPELKKITNDAIMIGSLRIMIFQGGILLFAVGIVQVLVSVDIIQTDRNFSLLSGGYSFYQLHHKLTHCRIFP